MRHAVSIYILSPCPPHMPLAVPLSIIYSGIPYLSAFYGPHATWNKRHSYLFRRGHPNRNPTISMTYTKLQHTSSFIERDTERREQ
jgi:hypothetical protein